MLYTLTCSICDKGFTSSQRTRMTCSRDCNRKRTAKIYGFFTENKHMKNVSTGAKGGIREAYVYLQLSENGVYVYSQFLAQSPLDAVVITPKGTAIKLEVGTGYRNSETGNITGQNKAPSHIKYQLLALYQPAEKTVHYFFDGKPIELAQVLEL